MGGDELRWTHVTAVVAHVLCIGAWAAAKEAGAPVALAFPEGSTNTRALRAQDVIVFEVAWSAATALGRVAWRDRGKPPGGGGWAEVVHGGRALGVQALCR